MNCSHLCSVSFTPRNAFLFPKSHHSHVLKYPPTHVFYTHTLYTNQHTHVLHEHTRFQVINQQARGQFRLDVTFKVLFSLYIQYTSQKYTVNLQRRSVRYTIKSAVVNDRFLDEDYKA